MQDSKICDILGCHRFDYLSQVGYDLNLTRGCHRFYYLAPLQVLDPIYLRPDLGQAQQCDGVKLINGDPKLTSFISKGKNLNTHNTPSTDCNTIEVH